MLRLLSTSLGRVISICGNIVISMIISRHAQ